MSDNVVPDLPDIRTPKTENEVMEINSPNGGTAPVAEIIIGEHSESLMEVPSGLIVVKDDATVQETAPNSEEIAAGEAVSDENKTEKTAPVQPSSAEQPKLAEEMEAIVTGAAIEAMPVADHDRRIRSRSSRYSEKDFVCPKPTVPPKKLISSTIESTEAKAVVQDTSKRSLRRRNDAPTSASVAEPKSKKLPAAHAIAATDSTAAPQAAAPEAVKAAQPTDSNAVASVELKIIFSSLFAAPATAVDAKAEPVAAAPTAIAVVAPAVPKPRGKRPRRETQVFQSLDFNANKKAFGDLRKKK